ncbi:MAG: guanylate cyclase, partial [Actinomycetia bacterium]|nr:guanylate cyclase [Actinomycetes bacterium]
MIVHSGRRLGHLVGDILDFSKLRHKSLELDPRPLDLRSLVDVVLTLSRPLLGSKELELSNSVPADLPAASADENRLQQILHNLIGNAVKFTESGSVEVSATPTEGGTAKHPPEGGTAQHADDGRVVVRVTDTGIGIPAEKQERIFDA